MLLLCLAPMPYGYFMLVRFVMMVACGWMAYQYYQRNKTVATWVFGILTMLFQPMYIDGIYICPHHPDKGFEGEVPEFKIDCDCRKPKIGLLKKAEARFNIDLKKSWFIGDTDRDIQTGINGGCRTIFLDTTPNPPIRFRDAKPDFVCHSLTEAVNLILTLERDDHD